MSTTEPDGPERASRDQEAGFRTLLRDGTFLVVLLLSVIGGLGVSGASPTLPGIAGEFAVSEARIGLVMSVFTFGGLLVLPFTGTLMDAYGRRPTVLVLLFLYGAGGTGVAFAQSFDQILVLRFIQGVGFTGTIPLSIAVIGDMYGGVAGSRAQGLRSSAIGLARVVIPAIAGFLAGLSWELPYLLNGLAFLALVLGYVYLAETSTVAADRSFQVPVSIREAVERAVTSLRGVAAELRHPTLIVLLGSGFVTFLGRMALVTFVPLFAVQSLGSSYFQAGVALSVTGVGRLVISPFAGWLEARVSLRTAFVGTIIPMAAGIGFAGVAPSIEWLYVILLIFGIGNALFQPIFNNTVTGLATEAYRARIVSLLALINSTAITIAPAMFGILLAIAGFDRMFAVAGVITVLPAIPIVLVVRG